MSLLSEQLLLELENNVTDFESPLCSVQVCTEDVIWRSGSDLAKEGQCSRHRYISVSPSDTDQVSLDYRLFIMPKSYTNLIVTASLHSAGSLCILQPSRAIGNGCSG